MVTRPAGYDRQEDSINPVAIKAGQHNVNAPGHETWGTVTCNDCGEKFFVGPNRIYSDRTLETKYVEKFEQILAEDHKRSAKHQDSYDLGW